MTRREYSMWGIRIIAVEPLAETSSGKRAQIGRNDSRSLILLSRSRAHSVRSASEQ